MYHMILSEMHQQEKWAIHVRGTLPVAQRRVAVVVDCVAHFVTRKSS